MPSSTSTISWLFIALSISPLSVSHSPSPKSQNNNWAVIVDTSRFWFNYRHIANALSLYHSVKLLGIPDSQIILMLADQMPCNARNCFVGQVFNSRVDKVNLYGTDVEVDYRGLQVTVANFITILTGRHEPGTPISKRLQTDENSNIFIYMAGHGGDGFLKFQDSEEISSQDIADAIQDMHVKKRYNEILFMVDTCQAGSLANAITAPNVITIGSSRVNENSYAHHADGELGVSVIDRFTYYTLDYLRRMKRSNSIDRATMKDLLEFYRPELLLSTPAYRIDLLERRIENIPVTDFLGSVLEIDVRYDEEAYPLQAASINALSDSEAEKIYRSWLPWPAQSHAIMNPEKRSNPNWIQVYSRKSKPFKFRIDFFAMLMLMILIVTLSTWR